MPEMIKCTSGVAPQVILSKQHYNHGVSHSMFSTCEKTKDKKCMIAPTLLKGVTIPRLWESVFSNDSDFLKRYHDRRKETDLEVGKWEYASDMGSGYRTVSLTTIVDVPKAGTLTQLHEAHRFAYTMSSTGNITLMYQISSQTPNLPAGQSFRTEAFLEITAPSVDGDTTVCVWGGCKKLSMTFSAIQYIAVPRAIREMTQAYRVMLEMISEDLIGDVVKLETGDESNGVGSAETDVPSAAGMDGSSQEPGTLFHGLMLLLAVVVTLSLLWSISTLRSTARVTAMMSEKLSDGLLHGDLSHSSLSGTFNMEKSTGVGAARAPLTQDQALQHAARDVQIQSLRYRWMEQRIAISNVESTVARLWLINTLQIFFMVLILLKIFFF